LLQRLDDLVSCHGDAILLRLRPAGAHRVEALIMNWLVWLGLAVVVAAVAAVTGVKTKGTRHVAHTRMMGVGRVVLFIIVLIFAWLAFQARNG
jgi:hypothetical protein